MKGSQGALQFTRAGLHTASNPGFKARWAQPSCWDAGSGNTAEQAFCCFRVGTENKTKICPETQPYVSSQHFGFYFEGMMLSTGFNLFHHPSNCH